MRAWVPPGVAALSALLLLGFPSAVHASFTGAVTGNSATLTGDAAGDTLVISQSGGQFRHNRFGTDPGFESDADFDSANPGVQSITTAGSINIDAGDGDDTISVGDFLPLNGAINGGNGNDTIDYGAFTSQAVDVNLGLNTLGLNGTFSGDQEVPPTPHTGTGTATVSNYNIAARTFDIAVAVSNLAPADVTGFHIHYGWVGLTGLIVVDLQALGSLVPSGSGFTFNATGVTWPRDLEAGLLGGATYVNIHTAAFPGGAVRAQLVPSGNVTVPAGRAWGLAGISGVENAIGGGGGDSLVGSSIPNTLNGGGGTDIILGGPANDTLGGGDENDLLIWSNGDGTDIMEGGPGLDTVQVNGNTSSNDSFTLSPNGTRLDFDRIITGVFSLDIGTVESLTVNGHGGNDSFTMNDPGAAEFIRVDFFGFGGDDTLTLLPVSQGTHNYYVHGGAGNDTVVGPNAAMTWHAPLPYQATIVGLMPTFRFVEFLCGGSGNDTFNVKAFAAGTATVAGGAGADTLIYDAEGRAFSGDTTPPDGTINSPGVQPFVFSQVESVSVINPANASPTITTIANQAIAANTSTAALPFTIGDAETPAENLTVTATSSNTTVVPVEAIEFGGSGASRTVTVAPALNQVGTSTITLTVTDTNGNSTSTNFLLTVNTPTTVQPPFDVYVSAMAGNLVTFRFTPSPLGPPATGFVLEGGLTPGSVAGSIPTGSALPIFTYPVPTGSFYVRLHGLNGAERSGPSNEIRIHVNVPVAPTAPDMFSSAISGSTVVLSWRNTFGGGAPSGTLLDVTGSATTTIPLGPAESTVVTGAPGGTYTLRLRSQNAAGASAQSAPLPLTIPSPCTGAPEAPSNFLLYRIGGTGYAVWDPPAAGPAPSSYVLNVAGSFVGSFPTTGRSLSGAVGPGSYHVSVTALNPCGPSPPTAVQTIVVP